MQIFISYRRDDSSVHARLLHRELSSYFGADEVFMDHEDIGWGDNFAQRIDEQLGTADVVVVVVGPRWVEIVQQREHGDDWVRHEVEQALRRRAQGRLRVLPALVGGAVWSRPRLPKGLAELPLLNALTLRDNAFDQDVQRLVEAIRQRSFWRELMAQALARRARFAALAVGGLVAVSAWTGALDLLTLDTRLDSLTLRMASAIGSPSAPSGELALQPVDEAAVAAVGRPFGPSWRAEHARVIDRAREAGARSLAFDLFFDQPGDAAADGALEAALGRAVDRLPVILGAAETAGDGTPALLPSLAGLAGWGLACAGQRLGVAYAMPLAAQRPGGARVAGLALAAYSGGGDVEAIDDLRQRVQVRVRSQQNSPSIPYYAGETLDRPSPACPILGPGDRVASQLIDPARPGAPFITVPYPDVLAGEPRALSALQDRVLLVGLALPGRDEFGLPGGGRVHGLRLIAAQLDALLRGRAVRAAGPGLVIGVSLGLGFAGAALAIAMNRWRAAWLAAAVGASAAGVLLASLLWLRSEGQLIGAHHGVLALCLGAVAARLTLRSRL